MTMVEQLYEVGSKLPALALAELLDFAEFFRLKRLPHSRSQCVGLMLKDHVRRHK